MSYSLLTQSMSTRFSSSDQIAVVTIANLEPNPKKKKKTWKFKNHNNTVSLKNIKNKVDLLILAFPDLS